MDITKAFKPDRARFFRPFPEEYAIAGQFLERCGGDMTILHSKPGWIFDNWCYLHDDDAGTVARQKGAVDFGVIFEHATRDVQNAVEDVIEKHLPDLTTILDPVDEIASCDDIWDMVQIGLEDRSERIRREGMDVKIDYPIAESFERRAELELVELRRKIALASQLTALELIDPAIDVSRDLTIVNRLCRERMFNGDIIRLRVNFVLQDDENCLLHPEFPVTFGAPEHRALPENAIPQSLPYTCRVVQDDESKTVFVVQSKSRPKARDVSIVKLSRGRQLMDRRGVRHLLVAVKDGDDWRVANRSDAEAYQRVARNRLWQGELQEVPDESAPNPDSSKNYWCQKIMGRLVRESRSRKGVVVAPSVEHQITTIDVDIADRFATDGTGHADYRKRVIRKYIKDAWFSWHLKNGNEDSP